MKPDVSIVLVTYNRARFLPRTLECILGQTYEAFELLICDDCSSDSTEQICREYALKDSRIRYRRNAKNLKMPGNLNAGIQSAACDLIAVMHDGDIYLPATVEKWRQALLDHPTAGFVFNVYRHLDADGTTGNLTSVYPGLIPGHEFLEKICFGDQQMECPVWGTVMARRSALEAMSFYDNRYGFWSDMDLYLRMAEQFDVAFVGETLIELPSREVMPHLFPSGAFTAHSTIFRIYWAARCRHFQARLPLLIEALVQQVFDFAISKSERVLRRVWNHLAPDRLQRWRQKPNPSAR